MMFLCQKKELLYNLWKKYPNKKILKDECKKYTDVPDKFIEDA